MTRPLTFFVNGERSLSRSHPLSCDQLATLQQNLVTEEKDDHADHDVLQLPEAVAGDGCRARQAAGRPGRGRVGLRPRLLPRGHPH